MEDQLVAVIGHKLRIHFEMLNNERAVVPDMGFDGFEGSVDA
jgi:hypothetical protein